MRLSQKRATILLCSVAGGVAAVRRSARPIHHHRHLSPRFKHGHNADGPARSRHAFSVARSAGARAAAPATGAARAPAARPHALMREPRSRTRIPPSAASPPTSWCPRRANIRHQPDRAPQPVVWRLHGHGAQRTGHAGGGNLALAMSITARASRAGVGAIAVMGRRGGGHVGVVMASTPTAIRSSSPATTIIRSPNRSIRAAASPPTWCPATVSVEKAAPCRPAGRGFLTFAAKVLTGVIRYARSLVNVRRRRSTFEFGKS